MTTLTTPLPQNFTPTQPGLKDLLDKFQQQLLINLNVHHIGTIKSFNPLLQTAVVSINYQKTYFTQDPITKQNTQSLVSYPLLADCPVVVLGGGLASLTFPIQSGDECLVLFNDRDIDNWYAGSSTAGVASTRLHSFSDALVIVGLHSLPNIILNYDTSRAVLRNGVAMVGVGATKVKVANALFTLNGLLQDLVTQINNLVTALTVNAANFILVTGAPGTPSPINPAIVTSLASVTTSLTLLSVELGQLLE